MSDKRKRGENGPSPTEQSRNKMPNINRTPTKQSQDDTPLSRVMLAELLKSSLEENAKLVFAKIEESEKNITSAVTEKVRELEEKVEQLSQENKELHARIERLERDQKRKNIVISGLQSTAHPQQQRTVVKEFLETHLKEPVNVTNAYGFKLRSGETKVVARLANLDQKSAIMRIKRSLPPNIFINDDLTKEERESRAKGRRFAKENAAPGDRVTVRTGSVSINEKVYKFDKETDTFTPAKN